MKKIRTISELKKFAIRIYEENIDEFDEDSTRYPLPPHQTIDFVAVAAIKVSFLVDIPKFVLECPEFLDFEVAGKTIADSVIDDLNSSVSVRKIIEVAFRSAVCKIITLYVQEQEKKRK